MRPIQDSNMCQSDHVVIIALICTLSYISRLTVLGFVGWRKTKPYYTYRSIQTLDADVPARQPGSGTGDTGPSTESHAASDIASACP